MKLSKKEIQLLIDVLEKLGVRLQFNKKKYPYYNALIEKLKKL